MKLCLAFGKASFGSREKKLAIGNTPQSAGWVMNNCGGARHTSHMMTKQVEQGKVLGRYITDPVWNSRELLRNWKADVSVAELCSESPSSYFVLRTWRMFTDEFLSSGPTHCSMRTPALYSPRSLPRSVSMLKGGGVHWGLVTGQPPRSSRTLRKGASPSFRICAVRPHSPHPPPCLQTTY